MVRDARHPQRPQDVGSSPGLVFQVCGGAGWWGSKPRRQAGAFLWGVRCEEWPAVHTARAFWFSLLLCCAGHSDLNGKPTLSRHLELLSHTVFPSVYMVAHGDVTLVRS